MRTFTCDHCGHMVFFENTICVHCGSTLAFHPQQMRMLALQPSRSTPDVWESISCTHDHRGTHVRMCRNRGCEGSACNFTTDIDGTQPYCVSCCQTRWLPNLSNPQNLLRTYKIEHAKRYLFYTLARLQLSSLQGLAAPVFDFLEELPDQAPVITGHANGVITLNVAEADDDERARIRLALLEPYRTLLGHLRHESGHFFWDILIRDTQWLTPFRAVFGDERADYAQALQSYYARGAAPSEDWHSNYISHYATAHPWEDWAETWAHYLHMMDVLETAASYELQLQLPDNIDHRPVIDNPFKLPAVSLKDLLQQYVPLTLVLNSLNRSLGHGDAYPFALSTGAIAKLGFIHEVIGAHRAQIGGATQAVP